MAPRTKDGKASNQTEETAESLEGTRIVVKLDDLLYERRMTLTELAERIGITLANLSILKTGKAKAMRFSTLEAICRELGCQPGDLLGYDAGEDA
jgi:putative transcriptional regulator